MLRRLLPRAWTSSPAGGRWLQRGLPTSLRLYHHFTKDDGLAILRLSSAATTVEEAVAMAERAWDAHATGAAAAARPFLHVVQVHDPERLAMERPSARAGPTAAPVVAVTAERNQLDIDLRRQPAAAAAARDEEEEEEEEEQEAAAEDGEARLPLVSLTRGPRRRFRPRRAPRTMEDLKEEAAAAVEEDEDSGLVPLDEESTATVVSVGLLQPPPEGQEGPQVVLFPAEDASFPDLPGRSLHELLADAEGHSQPHTFLFANPGSFPLLELMRRLEMVLHKRHVVASFTRGAQSQRPRLLGVAGAAAGGGAGVDAMGRATDAASPALGVAIFGGGLGTEQIGAMTRALLGSSWLGSFALDSALQQRLFVPSHFSLGPQPVCERYRTEDYAEELSLFRLQTVLYPGCSQLVKVFEPRYRALIKRCLERQEPFGLIHDQSTVGTLCYISEVYNMDKDTGVSLLKVTGYRRFSLESGGTHVPPDSWGLWVARRAVFFEEEPLLDEGEAKELRDLTLQAEAALKLLNPEVSILPPPSDDKEGGGDNKQQAAAASFLLAQYLSENNVGGERRTLEFLASTSTVDRMRDCLDLLLQRVRRGAVGAVSGGAFAAARRAAEQGGGGGGGGSGGGGGGGRRGRGRREQD